MSNFLFGAAIPVLMFLFSVLQHGGVRGLRLFARALGRAAAKSLSMASYFFIPMAFLFLIFTLFDPQSFALGVKGLKTLSLFSVGWLALLVLPIFVVLIPSEAASLRMYLMSDMRTLTLAVLLSIGTVGAWWAVIVHGDADSMFLLLLFAFVMTFFLASLCGFTTWHLDKHRGTVNALERLSLIALLGASLYLLEGEAKAPSLLMGYAAGAIGLRFLQVLWRSAPPERLREERVPEPHAHAEGGLALVRLVTLATIAATLFAMGSRHLPAVLAALLVVADLSMVRSRYGYASVWFDWKGLEVTKVPRLLDELRLGRLGR